MEAAISSWSKIAEYSGLSEYEAKVYLSLVEQGTVGARKISTLCEVPRTKVYGTLKKLIDMGLVVEVPSKTKSFTAVPPDISLKSNLLIVKKRAEEFESIVSSLADTYRHKQILVEPKKIDVWLIHGRKRIFDKIRDLLSEANKSADIITNDNGAVLFFKTANKILDKLKNDGVKVTLLSPLNPNDTLTRELSYVCKIRTGNFNHPIFYICVDKKRFILNKMNSNDYELNTEGDVAIFSEEDSLLNMISLLLREPLSLEQYK